MPAYETSVRFSVLGPVRAWRGEQELDLGSPQQRVVLAALLLSRGRPLALGELIRAVWGEEPPTAAVSVLRTYVSRLRKILEPGRNQGEPPRLLVSVGDGYLLRIQEDALDLAVFERRVAEARKRQTEGELSAAAEPLPAGCRPLEFTTREDAVEWCERERANLVGAVHQAAGSGRRPGIAWRLPAVLWGFFYLRSHAHDWLDTTTTTGLAAARAAGDRTGEAQGLADRSAALRDSGRLEEAITPLRQAMTIFRELGHTEGRASTVANLGDAYLLSGHLRKAVEYTRRGLLIARATGNAARASR
ncbi:winged helix-turn-helix domain-containing protein [Streptomyces sp. NPDC001758]